MKRGEVIELAKVVFIIILVVCAVLILTLLIYDTSSEVLSKCANINASLKDKRVDFRCAEYLIINNTLGIG